MPICSSFPSGTIVFVRHGETHTNVANVKRAQRVLTDPAAYSQVLTRNGLNQAISVGQRLRGQVFVNAYCGTLTRTRYTRKVMSWFLPDLKWKFSNKLDELNSAILGAKPQQSQCIELYKRQEQAVLSIWRELCGSQGTTLVVTHGNVIRYLIGLALSIDVKKRFCLVADNCSLSSVIRDKNGRWHLLTANDTAHLDQAWLQFSHRHEIATT